MESTPSPRPVRSMTVLIVTKGNCCFSVRRFSLWNVAWFSQSFFRCSGTSPDLSVVAWPFATYVADHPDLSARLAGSIQ